MSYELKGLSDASTFRLPNASASTSWSAARMGRNGNPLLQRVALLGLCGLGSMSAVLASPPSGPRAALRLDLHPIAATPPPEKSSEPFPSSPPQRTSKPQPPLPPPGLGANVT